MIKDLRQKLLDRKAAAVESIDAMGHFLIIDRKCPQTIRDSWRNVSDYVRNYECDSCASCIYISEKEGRHYCQCALSELFRCEVDPEEDICKDYEEK